MKTLTVTLLVLGVFASAVFAQSKPQVAVSEPQAVKERSRVLAGWVRIVRGAESQYKSKHGRYGDLAALREAHLLDALTFESEKPAETTSDANLVPQSTHFEVTTSGDGEHFSALIWESLNEWSVSVHADETGGGDGLGHTQEIPLPEDSPQGPILSLAG